MKLVSIHTGKPQTITWKGREVTTSIFKKPVSGPVKVYIMGLESDSQSDLTIHGGLYKAVYAYPLEHYAWWKKNYPEHSFELGAFGENLVTTGILESTANIGDVIKIGSTVLRISQPRFPCYKLGVKFDDTKMIVNFHRSMKSGFYFQVIKEGVIQSGDKIEILEKGGQTSISDFIRAFTERKTQKSLIASILKDKYLLDEWRPFFEQQLQN